MIRLLDDLEKKLDIYRRNVKAETGKMPTRAGAVNAILRKALDGVEEIQPRSLIDLERRVKNLELALWPKARIKRVLPQRKLE